MIKGVLFDKDGTLIDFFSLWLHAAMEVVPCFIKENKLDESGELTEYILEALGVKNKAVDPAGPLAYKPYREIAEEVCAALENKNIFMDREVVKEQLEIMFNESVTGENAEISQFTDVRKMAEQLKNRRMYIGLATADTLTSAQNCLETIGVSDLFDYVGADDGVKRPKPEKDMFVEFQNRFGLHPKEIAVVGDTYNDMVFARQNGGISVGVLSGVSGRKDFHGEADYIIESVKELTGLLEQI